MLPINTNDLKKKQITSSLAQTAGADSYSISGSAGGLEGGSATPGAG